MIYILTSTETILNVDVRVQESRIGDSNVEGVLNLKLKQALTPQSFEEQQTYLTASATAAYVSFNKLEQRHRFRASVNLLACNNETYNFTQGSSSSGLGYALACFDSWWRINLQKNSSFSHPVFATGEVLTSGHIKTIGHIVEKLESTCKYVEQNQDSISSFYLCYPQDNDKDIPGALRKRLVSLGGILIPSERLQHTLGQLLGDVYDGDPLGRWQPFKGLKSFDYEDSVRFFGRDKDVERLYSDIKQNSGLLIVSGASGTGKSSLIKAGLIPKLEQEYDELHWAYCTPNALKEEQGVLRFILKQLFIAWDVKEQNIDELVSTLNHSIEEGITYLSSLVTPDTKQCLLYLDQYEEVFSQSEHNIDNIGSELSIIDALAKALPSLNIVLAIRNEYLGRLLDNQALRSPIISNVASQLTSQEWEAIVHEQALFSGITFESKGENNEALDTIIIEEAIKTPYALPMVSFLLEQLYSKAIDEDKHASVLQHKHYQALGGLTGAIAYRALTVLQESEASEKTISTFFDYFVGVNPEGLAFARCVELADIASNKILYNLVKGFIDANLIVSVAGDRDNSAIKLAHDSLFTHWDTLKKWIEGSKEYLLWRYSIDGQYTRWQKATTNKKDYLLKDKQILKEGKGYLKLNLICDSKLKGYLSASLKQKNRKKLNVFFVFIILPLLLVGIYQWDKTRIKTYYYSSVGERWGVPFGINELDVNYVKNRRSNYKFEYRKGKLIRLSHVNAYGTLTSDPKRENNAIWEYSYLENGRISSQIVKTEATKEIEKISYEFDGNKAIAKFDKGFGRKKFISAENFLSNSLDVFGNTFTSSKSDISQYILTFSKDGYLTKKHYQNAYGINSSIEGKYFGELFTYNDLGQIDSSLKLSESGEFIADKTGSIRTTFLYDYLGYLIEEQKYTVSGKLASKNYSLDEFGNIVSYWFTDENKNSYAPDGKFSSKKFKLDNSGSVIKELFYNEAGKGVDIQFSVVSIKYTYDSKGRKITDSYFNKYSKPAQANDNCYSHEIKYDAFGNEIEISCKDGNTELKNNIVGCAVMKFSYNPDHYPSEFYCFDSALMPALLSENKVHGKKLKYNNQGSVTKVSFVGPSGGAILNLNGVASISIKRDELGNGVEKRYFGLEGEPKAIEQGSLKGVFIRKHKFDERGNSIEESYFGENEQNILIFDEIHKATLKYDKQGRVTEKAFFDKNNKPALFGSFHLKRTIYSERANYIKSEEYLNDNFKKVTRFGQHYVSQELFEKRLADKGTFLKIVSQPDKAKVFINNSFVGVTPHIVTKPLAEAKLKLQLANYSDFIINTSVNYGSKQEVSYELMKKPIYTTQELEEASLLGNVEAMNSLGDRYVNGKGVKQDYHLAIGWYKKAAVQNYPKAIHNMGLLYKKGQGVEQSDLIAEKYFERSANLGFARSQFVLSQNYFNAKKLIDGMKWLKLSANHGDHEAQFALYEAFEKGLWGVNKNRGTALEWLNRLAINGHAEAMSILGRRYELGDGVSEDLQKAHDLYLTSAKLGNVSGALRLSFIHIRLGFLAQNHERLFNLMAQAMLSDSYNGYFVTDGLASFYEKGVSKEVDFKKAVELYKSAVAKGSKFSYFPLGSLYFDGRGVEKDIDQAFKWYQKAAEQEDVDGQLMLGKMYASGTGVEKDLTQAFQWYKKAAEQGSADGQLALGAMYESGEGVEQDLAKAFKWHQKAAEQGDDPTQ
jgi:TPR repeat protein